MATYRVPVLQDFSWQPPIKDKDLGTPPGGEAKGDRYIVSANGGAWSDGAAKDIAWWDGAAWQFDTPSEGWQCWVEDENAYYAFDGANWGIVDTTANASNISSHTIQIASLESKQVVDTGNISSHTIQIASLESEKVVLESDVSSHTIQIASLESEKVVLESDVSSHTIQIASLESKQVVDTGNISSHTIQLASAQDEGTYVAEYGAIEFTI